MFEFCFVAPGLPKKTSVLVTGTAPKTLSERIYEAFLYSALCSETVLPTLDKQLTALFRDSSLDLEELVFKAFGRLTSFALAAFHL